MRQLVFRGTGQFSIEQKARSPLRSHETRIAVLATGICGSDVHGYAGVNERRKPGMIMGHEIAGRVIELGGTSVHRVGDPVVVNPIVGCGACVTCEGGQPNLCEGREIYGCSLALPGGFADEIVVKNENVVAFPGAAPAEWGALVEPLAVGEHAVRVSALDPTSNVLVVGGGPIGLGVALAARKHGAERVVISEPVSDRRVIAQALGFEVTATMSEDLAGNAASSFDLAFDCVGIDATIEAALAAIRPKSRVVLVGIAEATIALPVTPVVIGEREVAGSSAYTPGDFAETARWVSSQEADLTPLIQARVPLDGLPGAFERYASGSERALKTLFKPSEAAAS
jgi:2-desacetyl-2-hydroxyethyl bacteriochlorophyllide A dehydrogenase